MELLMASHFIMDIKDTLNLTLRTATSNLTGFPLLLTPLRTSKIELQEHIKITPLQVYIVPTTATVEDLKNNLHKSTNPSFPPQLPPITIPDMITKQSTQLLISLLLKLKQFTKTTTTSD